MDSIESIILDYKNFFKKIIKISPNYIYYSRRISNQIMESINFEVYYLEWWESRGLYTYSWNYAHAVYPGHCETVESKLFVTWDIRLTSETILFFFFFFSFLLTLFPSIAIIRFQLAKSNPGCISRLHKVMLNPKGLGAIPSS